MKLKLFFIFGFIVAFALGYLTHTMMTKKEEKKDKTVKTPPISMKKEEDRLKLGAFSVSLNVKDLSTSKEFYEHLGFKVFAGSMEQNYLILKNENSLIGLFQGMFEGNILTFNPGWDENAKNTEDFDDVREIQQHIKNKNVALTLEADETTKGPASIMLTDPDGNVILIDQHR